MPFPLWPPRPLPARTRMKPCGALSTSCGWGDLLGFHCLFSAPFFTFSVSCWVHFPHVALLLVHLLEMGQQMLKEKKWEVIGGEWGRGRTEFPHSLRKMSPAELNLLVLNEVYTKIKRKQKRKGKKFSKTNHLLSIKCRNIVYCLI